MKHLQPNVDLREALASLCFYKRSKLPSYLAQHPLKTLIGETE
jgi:hypothetical protein